MNVNMSKLEPLFQSAYDFPQPELADPNHHEFIATGADLTPQTLLHAYSMGMFPWFNEGDPIAWYSPSPRCVLYPKHYKPSKSLLREMKKSTFMVNINHAFADVIDGCAAVRSYADSTWISPDMKQAYQQLHDLGYAMSIEIYEQNQLVGGLYGLKIGQGFFGESMFHTRTNASKMAFFVLATLCESSQFRWIDCQFPNEHLLSLGAEILNRRDFLQQLSVQIRKPAVDWSALYHQAVPIQTYVNKSLVLCEHDDGYTLNYQH